MMFVDPLGQTIILMGGFLLFGIAFAKARKIKEFEEQKS